MEYVHHVQLSILLAYSATRVIASVAVWVSIFKVAIVRPVQLTTARHAVILQIVFIVIVDIT